MKDQIIAPVKGTRDFYPEDQAFQNWLYAKCKKVAELFGFQEYEGPILESLELYAAKSGEELVKKQAFTLKDQSGKTLALRPEMTPTLARMVAQKVNELVFPVKWFTFGRRFRYEKPQKGRGREFFQWDVDLLGAEGPSADAEVIAVAAFFCQELGLSPKQITIKINDRKLLEKKLLEIEIPEEKIISTFRLADKKDKMTKQEFLEFAQEEQLTADQAKALLQILEEKNSFSQSEYLKELFAILKKYGVSEYVEFDPGIVRGLDYYTQTVFEIWDTQGQFRAIGGGGRYDDLVAKVGSSQKIPGVGFAVGDMVVAEVLKANRLYPQLSFNPTSVLVTIFSPDLQEKSFQITQRLRNNNINTEISLNYLPKMEKQIKYADKKNIPLVVIIGPEEVKNNTVTLKNLRTGLQKTLPEEELITEIKTAFSLL